MATANTDPTMIAEVPMQHHKLAVTQGVTGYGLHLHGLLSKWQTEWLLNYLLMAPHPGLADAADDVMEARFHMVPGSYPCEVIRRTASIEIIPQDDTIYAFNLYAFEPVLNRLIPLIRYLADASRLRGLAVLFNDLLHQLTKPEAPDAA